MANPGSLAEWLAYLETLHPKAIAMGLDRVAGVATSSTVVPCGNGSEQSVPQEIPAGFEVTVPSPFPSFVIDSG